MKHSESSKLVTLLMAAFPASRVSDATAPMYDRMLRDLEVTAATAAIARLISTAQWLPTIAEIREATMTIALGERRPGGDAWGDFLREVRRVGARGEPKFEDHLVERVVRALGWKELCMSENQAADRARFIELYDKLAITARRDLVTLGLPSIERYKELRATGKALPVSDAIGELMGIVTKTQSILDVESVDAESKTDEELPFTPTPPNKTEE